MIDVPARNVLAFDYGDSPTVALFSESDLFVRGLMGPFGSGKSSGCVMELVKIGAKQRPDGQGIRHAKFGVIRNTYPQLKDTTIRTVKDWLPPHAYGTWHETDHRLVVDKLDPTLHLEFLFRALDRPDHVSNLLSLELTAAWVNEAREVPWAIIEALQGRVGRFPAPIHGGCVGECIIMDTNPPDDESWWFKKFEDEQPEGWGVFKQPSGMSEHAENTSNLPAKYYERMLSMDKGSQQVYIHGLYGMLREGKPVYPDYTDSLHCVDFEPDPRHRLYAGWDFGLTPAVAFSTLTPLGQLRTFAEYTADDLYFPDFVERVVTEFGRDWPAFKLTEARHIGDPAGAARAAVARNNDEASCFKIAKGFGINMVPGIQAPLTRIGSVAYALRRINKGQPMTIIHKRCKKLRRGYMGRYQYRKVMVAGNDPRYHETPDKNEYSHIHDGNQYTHADVFGHLIKNIEDHRSSKRKPLDIPTLGTR